MDKNLAVHEQTLFYIVYSMSSVVAAAAKQVYFPAVLWHAVC